MTRYPLLTELCKDPGVAREVGELMVEVARVNNPGPTRAQLIALLSRIDAALACGDETPADEVPIKGS